MSLGFKRLNKARSNIPQPGRLAHSHTPVNTTSFKCRLLERNLWPSALFCVVRGFHGSL